MFDHHNKYPSLMQPTLYDMMKTKKLDNISCMKTQYKQFKPRHGIRYVCHEALQTIKIDIKASIPFKLKHLVFTILSRFFCNFKRKKKGVIQDQVTGYK